jgi:hypothetical protein
MLVNVAFGAKNVSIPVPPVNEEAPSIPVVSDQVYTINIYMILLAIIVYEMADLSIYYTISTCVK